LDIKNFLFSVFFGVNYFFSPQSAQRKVHKEKFALPECNYFSFSGLNADETDASQRG